jgi:hypothetical protein
MAKMGKSPLLVHKEITKKAKTNYVEKLLRKTIGTPKILPCRILSYKTYPQGFNINP